MAMHTARAQQIALGVGRPPRPSLSSTLAAPRYRGRPQSSPLKNEASLLPTLSSPCSLPHSADALAPADPAKSGAGPSQRQVRCSAQLAALASVRRSLGRGSQMDHSTPGLKLPQACCSPQPCRCRPPPTAPPPHRPTARIPAAPPPRRLPPAATPPRRTPPCLRNAHMRAASHRIASHRVASRRIASHRVASRRIASHRIASHRVASHRIASRRVASRRVAPLGAPSATPVRAHPPCAAYASPPTPPPPPPDPPCPCPHGSSTTRASPRSRPAHAYSRPPPGSTSARTTRAPQP